MPPSLSELPISQSCFDLILKYFIWKQSHTSMETAEAKYLSPLKTSTGVKYHP